jgi:hypothetical protein
MRGRYGILIAEDGKRINHGRNKVDSRRPRLNVDLEADPPHMQIRELFAGTALADPGGTSDIVQKETLFAMEHHYDFTPLAFAYFYVEQYSPDPAQVGGYSGDYYVMSGSAGTIFDAITYEVDQDGFRIIHRLESYGFSTGYQSPAPQYKFKVKFYIMATATGIPLATGVPL